MDDNEYIPKIDIVDLIKYAVGAPEAVTVILKIKKASAEVGFLFCLKPWRFKSIY